MFPSDAEYPDDLLPATLVSPEVSTPAILEEQLQASRVAQAGTAIATLVQDYGLATVGDLMAVLGIETVARLLAMLGFTGDLDGLACEIAPLLAQPISDVAHPVRDSA
jgi:hypothetical protein